MTATPQQAQVDAAPGEGAAAWLAGLTPLLMIGNEWVPAQSGMTFRTVNPATEQLLAEVAAGDTADVDAAVRAARTAFDDGPWTRLSPADRSRMLRDLAALVEANAEQLAELDTLDNGMTLATARSLVARAVGYLYHYSGAASFITGETMTTPPGSFQYSLREPIGVCAGIIPWNGPTLLACQKIGPALAAGNTLILKPAEQTPLSALRLAELVLDAGFPPGVINVVTGLGETAGAALTAHPGVDKVVFTGSPEVGKKIIASSADTVKRLTLELGGKSPNIIFPDADLDAAIPAAFRGFSMLSGQICIAATRLFVQREAKDEVVERLAGYAAAARVGDPFDPATTLGPLVSREQVDRVAGYVETGKSEGAVARTGGKPLPGPGYFVTPTVFDAVRNSMRIAQEEIFGPVVSVIPFTDADDAVLQGNDTSYGLAAAVWTRDISTAHAVARRLRAGTVWVNTYGTTLPAMPFGGYKESGLGNDRGPHWYEQYTQQKAVYVQL